MSLTTIIVIAVVVLLVVMGAANRKKLSLLISSEATRMLKKATNTITVMKHRVEQYKKQIDDLIENAGAVYANIRQTERNLKSIETKRETARVKALSAKNADNKDEAKKCLKIMNQCDIEIQSLKNTITALKSAESKIKENIGKAKEAITRYNLRISTIEARMQSNEVLNMVSKHGTAVAGISLDDTLNELEEDALIKEDQISKVIEIEEEEKVEENDVDIDKQYEELK